MRFADTDLPGAGRSIQHPRQADLRLQYKRYQHWWLPNLRSTIAAGFWEQDVNSQLIGPVEANSANHVLWNTFANLVWNPVAFITTGVEYMYGKRITVAGAKGNENVLIGKFRVAF